MVLLEALSLSVGIQNNNRSILGRYKTWRNASFRHENGSGVKKVRRIGARARGEGGGAGDFHKHPTSMLDVV